MKQMTYDVGMTTTTRQPLTRERVIEAAVAYADEHGVDDMSMRKLGAELGVEAMSLYNHVDNKDDLYSGMVDWVFSQITLADATLVWKEQARIIGRDALEVFRAHPWVVSLLMTIGNFGDGALRFMNHVLNVLLDAGLSDEDAHHAWQMLASHTMGYAFQSMGGKGTHHKDFSSIEEQLPRISREFPNVARLAPLLIDCSWDTEYQFGLEIILDGLEARLG